MRQLAKAAVWVIECVLCADSFGNAPRSSWSRLKGIACGGSFCCLARWALWIPAAVFSDERLELGPLSFVELTCASVASRAILLVAGVRHDVGCLK